MTLDDIGDAHRATDHLKPLLPEFHGAGLIGFANGLGVLLIYNFIIGLGLTWPWAAIISLFSGYVIARQHANVMWKPYHQQFTLFLAERAKRNPLSLDTSL